MLDFLGVFVFDGEIFEGGEFLVWFGLELEFVIL